MRPPPLRSPSAGSARVATAIRGAAPATLAIGIAAILTVTAVGVALAVRRRPPAQWGADAWSSIPTPPRPRPPRARPPDGMRIDPAAVETPPPPAVTPAPDAGPAATRPEAPATPAAEGPAARHAEPAGAPHPDASPRPDAFPAAAPSPASEPSPATPPSTGSASAPSSPSSSPTPPPTPPPTPAAPSGTVPPSAVPPTAVPPSAGAAPWLAVVVGPGASGAIADATRRVAATALVTPAARPLAFRGSASSDAGPSVEAFRVRVEREAVTLVDPPSVDVGADPVADLVPPVRLLGAILREVPLAASPTAHGALLVALASILAGDGPSASAALRDAPGDPGVRLLRAAAALVARDWAAVHTAAFGLGDDRALGPVARVLTGAALRADRNPREAVRDFEAAVDARPDLWPARLLAAEAYESEDLALPDRAAAAYEATARAAPDEPAAAIGHAYYLASKDRAASRAIVDRLLARHPGVAAGWRLLSWLRTQGGTSEDLQASVVALEHVVELQRDDPQAWADLGAARWRWASSGGGRAALLGAAEAFGQQTDRSPDDAGAWFRRGAAIHQAAADTAPMGDPTAVRARLVEARTCYGRALTLGLRKEDAARAHFNVGLVTELLPAGTPPTPGVATTASAAFDAALAADPAFGPAAYALVASRIAERDGAAAERALARAPAATSEDEKRERAVLEAGAAWARGDLARARALLAGPAGVAAEGGDPVSALARAVFVLGYRRAVLAIVAGDAPDAARLALRARACAGLKDVDATREALERLRAVDAAAAADLRRRDPEITAALGPEVVVGPPAR